MSPSFLQKLKQVQIDIWLVAWSPHISHNTPWKHEQGENQHMLVLQISWLPFSA